MRKGLGIITVLLFSSSLFAQKISLDLAGIRQMGHATNGLNVAGFYHFNEQLSGGIEINRFFPVTRNGYEEEYSLSAWDLELNFHFYMALSRHLQVYPISGISHTSEKEHSLHSGNNHFEKFWSYNTGAGLLWHHKKWAPHAEYILTWGHLDQQFLLVGISYELEWGRHKK